MNKEKQYKEKLERHDDPRYTFEHWENGRFYPTYGMDTNDLRELRKEYKEDVKNLNAEKIDTRAIIIPNIYGSILKSYYTHVCAIIQGKFYKLWEGYSATTMKHINIYRKMYGFNTISKREWVMMDTVSEIIDNTTGEIIYEN